MAVERLKVTFKFKDKGVESKVFVVGQLRPSHKRVWTEPNKGHYRATNALTSP